MEIDRQKIRGPVRCFNCRQIGHYSSSCTKPRKGTKKQQVRSMEVDAQPPNKAKGKQKAQTGKGTHHIRAFLDELDDEGKNELLDQMIKETDS
jgi:hypothetical protein